MQLPLIQVVAFVFLASFYAAPILAPFFCALIVSIFELLPLEKYERMKPFKLARLYDAGGDLTKRWYIEFYVWDDRKGDKVRKRYYQINDYETEVERRAAAKKQIKEINELLKDGYYIKADGVGEEQIEKKRIKEQPAIHSIEKAFKSILEIKATEVRKKSLQKISSIGSIFQAFIRPKLYLHQISKIDLIKYSDYLLTARKVTPQTRNNHLRFLKSLFNDMLDRGWLEENPAAEYKKMKETVSAKNKAYSKTQQKQILALADAQLKLTIQFLYYCFMRPNEVRLLKVKDINLKEKRIFIPAEVAKNRKNEYVALPLQLIEALKEIKLENANPEDYISGKTSIKNEIIPGKIPFSINHMSYRHRQLLEKIGLNDGDHTLYSWKHTGVIAAYQVGVDIKSIQLQCRHYSLEMTDKYLKSLGLFRDDEVFLKMPKL